MKTKTNPGDFPMQAIVLADLVNTGRNKTVIYQPENLTTRTTSKRWRATASIQVILPDDCQNITIDLSSPSKAKVRYKVIKNPLTLHG